MQTSKQRRRTIAAAVAACTAIASVPFWAYAENQDDGITVCVNEVRLAFEVNPITENDRTLVPMRTVLEALGAELAWDSNTDTATATLGDVTLSIAADSNLLYKNGTPTALDTPARIIGGRILVPVRALSETLNAKVAWDEDTKTVSVTTAPPDTETASESRNAFAFQMNHFMNKDENYFFSPMSIKMAMAMAANGSRGETKTELLHALGIADIEAYSHETKAVIERTKSEGDFDYAAYNALIERINSGTAADADYEQYTKMREERSDYERNPLRIANSIWVNRDYGKDDGYTPKFKPEFETIIQTYYDGTSEVVGNEDAVKRINDWVSEKTMGKIPSILDKPDFLAALVNAVYFKGKWVHEFSETATKPDTFTNADGTKTQADFMHLYREHLDYYADSRIEGVRLPYTSGMSMYLFKDDGSIQNYDPYFGRMKSECLNLAMPKFKIAYEKVLNGLLRDMGITKAFSPDNAEFEDMCDGIPDSLNVYIDRVLHKTYISVDEKGTEAAAVTAVMMAGATAAMPMPEPKEFKADSPFTFIIRDDQSGEIVFMGRTATLQQQNK